MRVMGPNARQTVGLQLDANLKLIAIGLIHAALDLLHSGQYSEQVLHMMTYLVRDHIGLRKLAAGASHLASTKPALQILEECRVEIHLLVIRAVERPHGGLG